MFPILLIAIGIAVLVFGRRLSVLGAAVGALLGVVLLNLLSGSSELWVQLAVVLGLALAGFFAAAFARGIIDIVILVIGALAGAEVVLSLLDLFKVDLGVVNWLLAVVGAVIGFMLIRRARRGTRDWGMIILSSLVGALLVTRGLTQLVPSLQDTLISTLVLVVLVVASIVYQGGWLTGRSAAKSATPVPPPAPPPSTGSSTTPGDKQPPAGP